jgi:hypothetical protein
MEHEAYEITMLSVHVSATKKCWTSCKTHEIQQGGHVTVGDLEAILFNPVALTISKW